RPPHLLMAGPQHSHPPPARQNLLHRPERRQRNPKQPTQSLLEEVADQPPMGPPQSHVILSEVVRDFANGESKDLRLPFCLSFRTLSEVEWGRNLPAAPS